MEHDKPNDWREARRFRAFDLSQMGWTGTAIAEALGVSESAVSTWLKRAREGGGKAALRTVKASGRPPELSPEQLAQLPEALKRGAEHFGFRGQVWTRSRVGAVIGRLFGVSYSDSHVGRLIAKIEREPPEADAACSTTRRRSHRVLGLDRLAAHQKKAELEDRTVIFVDEAGFYVLPAVVRTYAPRGQTPMLKAPLLYEHLSAISGITAEGRLLMRVQDRSIRGPDVVRFLGHLLRHIDGKLTVIWDGLPAHRGHVVKQFLRDGAAARIHLEQLPSYAPELNPDEGVWKHLKVVELRNLCCWNVAHLRVELRKAKERLRHKREVIEACFRQVGLV
ncbi:MAG: IS630 family transposase [Rhodothermales bacterium]